MTMGALHHTNSYTPIINSDFGMCAPTPLRHQHIFRHICCCSYYGRHDLLLGSSLAAPRMLCQYRVESILGEMFSNYATLQ